jgi:hypothetical protein
MRIIKLAIISAVILFLVIFGMSLLIPSHIRISRAANIEVSKDSLVAALTDMRQWKKWNILVNDTGVTNQQYTTDSFSSDHQKVTKRLQVGDTLITAWQQQKGHVLTSGFTWQGNGNQFVVQWYFDFQLRWYPWEKFSSIVFDKQLGPPMEKSLSNLKKLLEKQP